MNKLAYNVMDAIMAVNSMALVGIGALIASNDMIEVDLVLIYSIWFFAVSAILVCLYYFLERWAETSSNPGLSMRNLGGFATISVMGGIVFTIAGIVFLLIALFMQAPT